MAKKFTPEVLARAAEMRASGQSVYDIAAAVGASYRSTYAALKRAEIVTGRLPARPNLKSPPQLTRRAVSLRLHAGKTQGEIAREFGVTRHQVKGFICRNDLTRFDSHLIMLGELALEVGIEQDTLVKHIQAGRFEARRYAHMWAFNREQAKAVRAYYATRKPADLYADWMTTAEAAAALGMTTGGLTGEWRAGRLSLTPVKVRARHNFAYRWNPEEVHVLASQRRARKRAA